MKIGKYEIYALETGEFALDGGAMFGIIPKPLWERSNPADEKNRIRLGARCLLLKTESKKILVDTGVGGYWDDKFRKIYNLQDESVNLFTSLGNYGVSADEITDVILTHLHFDHTGGALIHNNGKWEPAFPNANYYVQKEHFQWALNPSERDRGSFIKNRFEPLAAEGVLKTIDSSEFDENIEFVVVNGHTFAQQMVKISDGSQTLLYCADLLPTSSHIPVPYVMGYDLQPLLTVKEKNEILPKAADEEWLLFFEHDPVYVAAKVGIGSKGFFAKHKIKELL